MGRIVIGDSRLVLKQMPDASVDCCVTSPPYWGLRDYGVNGQIGLEKTPGQYVYELVAVFQEVWRVLKPTGTVWLNLGDSYAGAGRGGGGNLKGNEHGQGGFHHKANSRVPDGMKPKDMVGIPWRVAFALQAFGWYLRSDIIWHKPNPIPESVRDRPTKAHEYIFLLSKAKKYFFDSKAFSEPVVSAEYDKRRMKEGRPRTGEKYLGLEDKRFSATRRSKLGHQNKLGDGERRNRRTVWTVSTKPFNGSIKTVRWVRVSSGDVSDGMRRITSLDCPRHGHLDFPSDEHEGGSSMSSPHNGRRRAESPISDLSETTTQSDLSQTASNTDFSVPPCLAFATDRNTETNKIDRAPHISERDTACAQTSFGKQSTIPPGAPADSAGRIYASNTLPDVLDDHLLAQTVSCIVDSSSLPVPSGCRCGYYRKTTEKTSHFATFPADLIEPCILAGCPEGGTVLDPFFGAGTTGLVADRLQREWIGIELNPEYAAIAKERLGLSAEMKGQE